MSRLIKGIASVAVLAGVGFAAQPAEAAPFLTVNLLGRVQNGSYSTNTAPFTSTVNIEPGQVLEYVVEYQLAPSGASNPFIGTADPSMRTINSWNPSPNYGLNSLFFSLNQPAANPGTKVDFNAQTIALTTGDEDLGENSSWTGGTGNSRGTLTPRGDGNDDLTAIQLYRSSGNFDGIALDESLEVIRVVRGLAPVTGGGGTSTLNMNLQGYPNNPQQPNPFIAAFKFRNANDTGDVIATPTLLEQQASESAGDPIIVYTDLTLVSIPEPTTLGVLGTVGALGLLARRRRVH